MEPATQKPVLLRDGHVEKNEFLSLLEQNIIIEIPCRTNGSGHDIGSDNV